MRAIILLSLVGAAFASPSIEPKLLQTLETSQTANIFVSFNAGVSSVLQSMKAVKFLSRESKLNIIHSSLTRHAAETQSNVKSFLSNSDVKFDSFYISNQIYIANADMKLITELSAFGEISKITEEIIAHIDTPIPADIFASPKAPEWGINNVQAPQVWALGARGNGVVVGIIDTGVRFTHEAISTQYAGPSGRYSWYDPQEKTAEPLDELGHGTHITGTICGSPDIGVAPSAQYMACRGCPSGACPQSLLMACAQFMLCPHNTNGENERCEDAPHIVSNSWGGSGGQDYFDDVIESWHSVGIIPVFAIGNSGPNCQTVGYPGEGNVIGVGAIGSDNRITGSSSAGPSSSNGIKPDVAAPGALIRSAYHLADDSYSTLSGTSMATPHVAGVIALMLSKNPGLTYQTVRQHLFEGCQITSPTGRNCGSIDENRYPNHHVGYGKVNALNSWHAVPIQS